VDPPIAGWLIAAVVVASVFFKWRGSIKGLARPPAV
jgi:hypothetical protein